MIKDPRIEAARMRAQADAAVPGINEAGGLAMTSAQADHLRALCAATGEAFDGSLSEADAAVRIEDLEARLAED